jgi:DNA polymerase-3 subunit epsilon
MKLLILDCETTGLDFATDEVCEVGAILYDTDKGTLCELSFVVKTERDPAWVTGIPAGVKNAVEVNHAAHKMLEAMHGEAEYLVAHNADFDRRFLVRDYGVLDYSNKPWLCTYSDFRWPKCEPTNLVAIALAHGLGVATAHRALADCQLMARLFDALRRDGLFDDTLKAAMVPRAWYAADLPYAQRDKAKAAGFRWEPDAKQWRKRLTDDEAKALTFAVYKVPSGYDLGGSDVMP